MKNFQSVLFIVALMLLMTACDEENLNPTIAPSTEISTELRNVSSFSKIDIEDNFEVMVTFVAEDLEVKVEANENLQSLILVEQQGATLAIRFANNVNISGNATAKVHIRIPELTAIQANDDASIQFLTLLKTKSIDFDLNDDADLQGEIQVENLFVQLNDGSKLHLKGEAEAAEMSLNDASKFIDYDFSTDDLDISLNDGSDAYITVNQTLRVRAQDGSVLHYKGDAVIERQEISDGAEVRKED